MFMTIKTIGIKEFRKNITEISKKAKKGKVRFIVMNHLNPLFEVKPIDNLDDLEDQLIVQKFGKQIERGMKDFREGKAIPAEEVYKRLGLR